VHRQYLISQVSYLLTDSPSPAYAETMFTSFGALTMTARTPIPGDEAEILGRVVAVLRRV
jgi:hypothetical protein